MDINANKYKKTDATNGSLTRIYNKRCTQQLNENLVVSTNDNKWNISEGTNANIKEERIKQKTNQN